LKNNPCVVKGLVSAIKRENWEKIKKMHEYFFCYDYYSLSWNMENELKRNRNFMFNGNGKTWLTWIMNI
jgi:hypothetical protein